jgi:hypothetical protein
MLPAGGRFSVAGETASEADKMRQVQGIVFVDGPGGHRAHIAGTGLDVLDVIRGFRICGEDRTAFYETFESYPEETLSVAFHYYRAFPEEIDALLDQEEVILAE